MKDILNQNNDRIKTEFNRIIRFAVLFLVILLGITVFNSAQIQRDMEDVLHIDKSSLITVTHPDGTSETYTGNSFRKTALGDIVTARLELPEKPGNSNYSLFAVEYNKILTVSFEGNILFRYGDELYKKGQEIGKLLVSADIPDDAWGKYLDFSYEVADYSFNTSLPVIEIRKSSERNKFLLHGLSLPYLISVMFFVVCCILSVPFFLWHGGKIRSEGLKILLIGISTMMWSMGYQHMFLVTEDNGFISGNIEYFGIFSIPATFIMFLNEITGEGKLKKIINAAEKIYIFLFIAFTLLNFLTGNYHYCRFLVINHIQLAVLFVFTAVFCIQNRKTNDIHIRSIVKASAVFGVFAAVDYILFFLSSKGLYLTSVSFISFGIFAFILIMFMTYAAYVTESIIAARDRERLEKLAYTDGMTGVSNRRACLEYIKEMDRSQSHDSYGIVFVDVNNLKLANDKYSHDTGDKLICFVAGALSEVFGDGCFCGRYGGDEFIAGIQCHGSADDEIKKRLSEFDRFLSEINLKGEFPFEVSVSYGYAVSSDNPGKSTMELLGIADQRMYEHKKKIKSQSGNEIL